MIHNYKKYPQIPFKFLFPTPDDFLNAVKNNGFITDKEALDINLIKFLFNNIKNKVVKNVKNEDLIDSNLISIKNNLAQGWTQLANSIFLDSALVEKKIEDLILNKQTRKSAAYSPQPNTSENVEKYDFENELIDGATQDEISETNPLRALTQVSAVRANYKDNTLKMKLINAYIDYYLMTEEENVIVDYKYEGFINSSRVINDSDISNNGINPQLNQVDQNKQDIDKLKNDVKTNTNDIDKLKNDVKTNTNDIKNNTESLQKKEDEINQLNRFNSEMNEAINLDSYPESNKKYVNQQVQVIYNTPAPKITYDLTADFNLNKANWKDWFADKDSINLTDGINITDPKCLKVYCYGSIKNDDGLNDILNVNYEFDNIYLSGIQVCQYPNRNDSFDTTTTTPYMTPVIACNLNLYTDANDHVLLDLIFSRTAGNEFKTLTLDFYTSITLMFKADPVKITSSMVLNHYGQTPKEQLATTSKDVVEAINELKNSGSGGNDSQITLFTKKLDDYFKPLNYKYTIFKDQSGGPIDTKINLDPNNLFFSWFYTITGIFDVNGKRYNDRYDFLTINILENNTYLLFKVDDNFNYSFPGILSAFVNTHKSTEGLDFSKATHLQHMLSYTALGMGQFGGSKNTLTIDPNRLLFAPNLTLTFAANAGGSNTLALTPFSLWQKLIPSLQKFDDLQNDPNAKEYIAMVDINRNFSYKNVLGDVFRAVKDFVIVNQAIVKGTEIYIYSTELLNSKIDDENDILKAKLDKLTITSTNSPLSWYLGTDFITQMSKSSIINGKKHRTIAYTFYPIDGRNTYIVVNCVWNTTDGTLILRGTVIGTRTNRPELKINFDFYILGHLG